MPNHRMDFHLYDTDEPHLARLSLDQRAALTANEHDGMTYENAGQWLQVPVNTIKTRVHRSRLLILKMRAEAAQQPEQADAV